MHRRLPEDDRAVSTMVAYTLTLAIATLAVVGLLTAGSSFVEDSREQAIRDELGVIGQQLSADLSRADRLVVAADSPNPQVQIDAEYPDRAVGISYRVRLKPAANELILESSNPSIDISVTVGVETQTDLSDSTTEGGSIRIAYDTSTDALEVIDD